MHKDLALHQSTQIHANSSSTVRVKWIHSVANVHKRLINIMDLIIEDVVTQLNTSCSTRAPQWLSSGDMSDLWVSWIEHTGRFLHASRVRNKRKPYSHACWEICGVERRDGSNNRPKSISEQDRRRTMKHKHSFKCPGEMERSVCHLEVRNGTMPVCQALVNSMQGYSTAWFTFLLSTAMLCST